MAKAPKTVKIGVYIQQKTFDRMSETARSLGVSKSSFVNTLIVTFLEKEEYILSQVQTNQMSIMTRLNTLDEKMVIGIDLTSKMIIAFFQQYSPEKKNEKIEGVIRNLIVDLQSENTFWNMLEQFAKEKK